MDFSRRILSIIAIMICLVGASTSAFAEIPVGEITINVKNVTINTPAQESSGGNPYADTFVDEMITMFIGFIGGGIGLIWIVLSKRKTDSMDLEKKKLENNIEFEKTTLLNRVILEQKRKTDELDIEKQKSMPTTLQQDKIFNEAAEKAYYQSYLDIWTKIWKTIHSKTSVKEQDNFIEYLWKNYFGKKLIPSEDSLEEIIKAENLKELDPPPEKTQEDAIGDMMDFLQEKIKRFHLNSLKSGKDFSNSDIDFIKKKLRNLFNNADVEYYQYIEKETPALVERAVLSTNINRDPTKSEDIDTWKNDAIKELKRLMIFSLLRNDIGVLETMVKAEINKNISKSGAVMPKTSPKKTVPEKPTPKKNIPKKNPSKRKRR